jgi:hypothetical protein
MDFVLCQILWMDRLLLVPCELLLMLLMLVLLVLLMLLLLVVGNVTLCWL